MARSYEKQCDCGTLLRITESPSDGWLIYEVDTGFVHQCGGIKENNISSYDGPLTVRTNCWFCGETVFFHRSENGGMVLFDNLGTPWPIHPCWKSNARHRNKYLNKLYETLKKHNLSTKTGDYDFISKGISVGKPSTNIYLKSVDHRALEVSVKNIVVILLRFGVIPTKVIPLPTRFRIENQDKIKLFKRIVTFEHGFSPSMLEKQQMVIQAMQRLDIPNVVDITIQSDE